MPDILPVCTTRSGIGGKWINGVWNVPVYCMNCGKQHGFCNESAVQRKEYVGYLCDTCAESWSPLVGTMLIPDQVHWQLAREAQLEEYGRDLTVTEQIRELDDVNSPLSRFARGL